MIPAKSLVRRIWSRVRAERIALMAAGLSYYLLAGFLPILVLASGVVGRLSERNNITAQTVIDELGVRGQAATVIADSIEHSEQVHVTSSIVGLLGVLWAALAVTGALRRTVDAVWGVPDVGWTARLRSLPWAVVAAVLGAGSVASTAWSAWSGQGSRLAAAVLGLAFTTALAAWFLSRLGSCVTTRHALVVSTAVLAVGLEVIKYGAAFVVPSLISRESLLYGSLGTALGLLVLVLVTSWLMLIATALAAELSVAEHPLRRKPVLRERTRRWSWLWSTQQGRGVSDAGR